MPQFRRLVPLVMNVVGAESTTETPPPESPLSARKTSNHYSRTTTSWPARRPPRPARHFRQHARRVLAAHRHGELAPGETHRRLQRRHPFMTLSERRFAPKTVRKDREGVRQNQDTHRRRRRFLRQPHLFEHMARTFGAGEWRVFFTITLPLARRGVLAGTLLAFARSLGEFGATILVAGNLPGRTTTFPVAVYQAVQAGEDSHAWTMAGVSIVIAFATVFASESCLRRCG